MQPLDDARRAQAPCSIVVLTYNRAATVLETLGKLVALDEPWPIVVVDNGSTDGTADQIAARFPDITLVRVPRNYGAAGRNFGVASVDTPYVAFCDDDTAWLPGSVARAVDVLQRAHELAPDSSLVENNLALAEARANQQTQLRALLATITDVRRRKQVTDFVADWAPTPVRSPAVPSREGLSP